MARFMTPWWLVRHVLMLVLVVAFGMLGWWQIGRARGGNTLSFGYALEWPLFAAFVVFVWVHEIRTELRRNDRPAPGPTVAVSAELSAQPGYLPFRAMTPVADDRETDDRDPDDRDPDDRDPDDRDPDLVAYNRYLEWLAANPGRRPSEYQRSEG